MESCDKSFIPHYRGSSYIYPQRLTLGFTCRANPTKIKDLLTRGQVQAVIGVPGSFSSDSLRQQLCSSLKFREELGTCTWV